MEEKRKIQNFFDDESDSVGSKVPYDEVPIQRGGYSGRFQTSRSQFGERKFEKRTHQLPAKNIIVLYCILAALFLVNVVMGALLYNVYSMQKEESSNININYTGDIISSSTDMQLASSRGLLSTCSIATSKNSSAVFANETQFFSRNADSWGSGVVLNIDKTNGDIYIVTNFHVIYSYDITNYYPTIYVLLSDSVIPIRMTLVGGSATYDVAVLRAVGNSEVKVSNARAAVFADSLDIFYGQPCVAIGNSRASGLQSTTGIVSLEEDVLYGKNQNQDIKFLLLRHSAEINGGNSGGGLFDSSGRLIGLVNGRFSSEITGFIKSEDVIQGMNYAVPSSIVKSIADNIIYYSVANSSIDFTHIQKPIIGIVSEEVFDSNGIKISSNCTIGGKSVVSSSSGAQVNYQIMVNANIGGFQAGDIIKSFNYNGQTFLCNRRFSIDSHIYNLRIGDTIKFYVQRVGKSGLVEISIIISEFVSIL